MSKPKALVVDVDGTVARRTDERPDPYDMTRVSLDAPIQPIIDLANTLASVHDAAILIVTAREDTGNCYVDTLAWLHKHGLFPRDMFMRTNKDYRADAIVKSEFYRDMIAPNYEVLYVLDDRDPVVKMWREEHGLTCLQVAEGSFLWKHGILSRTILSIRLVT